LNRWPLNAVSGTAATGTKRGAQCAAQRQKADSIRAGWKVI